MHFYLTIFEEIIFKMLKRNEETNYKDTLLIMKKTLKNSLFCF